MALIRGLRGLCPCPKCHVPKDKLSDLTQKHKLRTARGTQNIFESAVGLGATAWEEIFKKHSLRDIKVSLGNGMYRILTDLAAKNAFHQMTYTDPHQALCFDCLHTFHGGLFGDHLFPQIKHHIESLGRHAIKSVDDQ
jgi:hypothetical protein